MWQISVEGLKYYIVLSGLNCRELKDSVVAHQSAHWRSMKTISEMSVHLVQATKESKAMAELNLMPPEVSTINKVKFTRDSGPCLRCGGPHIQSRCTKYINQPNNRSQSTSSTRQNYRRIDNQQKFGDNKNNNSMFPRETLSFQVLQQVISGDDISPLSASF